MTYQTKSKIKMIMILFIVAFVVVGIGVGLHFYKDKEPTHGIFVQNHRMKEGGCGHLYKSS